MKREVGHKSTVWLRGEWTGTTEPQVIAEGDIADRLCALLKDLVVQRSRASRCCVELITNTSGKYQLRSDGRVWADAVDDSDVPDEVVRMLLRAALDAEFSLVHIHAGAVKRDDRTAVIAGIPGSGKSTAIVALVEAGFGYITDERLTVSADGHAVAGFPKPISLIGGSMRALAHLDPERTGHGESNGSVWQIPASSIGSCAPQAFTSASIVIFITYRENAALRSQSVTPADAAARLLSDSPDVGTRGHDGVDAIVSLVTSVPNIEIEYSRTEDLVSMVSQLLDNPPTVAETAPLALRGDVRPSRTAPVAAIDIDTSESFAMLEGSSAWVIGDLAVTYAHPTGAVVELDETSTIWLQLLDKSHTVDQLVEEVADATGSDVASVRSAARQIMHGSWASDIIGPVAA